MRYFVNIDLKYIINLCIIVKRNYSMFSKELLKGTLKPIILKLLSENDKMYGYEIVQAVKQLTDEKIVIKEGSLYPLLHDVFKLSVKEFISSLILANSALTEFDISSSELRDIAFSI